MIALWSTTYNDLTGQAIVTRRVVEHVLPRFGASREYVFPSTGRPRAIALWLSVVLRLWFEIANGRVDTLYLVCSRSSIGFIRDVPALLAAKAGVRVIVHSHGSDIMLLLAGRKVSPLARWLYRNCHIIVPSEHLRVSLLPYVRSVHVCENFYAGSVKSVEAGKNAKIGDLTVLWNSNVMASKGFFDVFSAVRALRADDLPVTLISLGALVADEELGTDALKKRFSALGTPGWFEYRGRQPHERAVKILEQADVVCFPSRYSSECQPIAIIEAMCGGKAIVASDTPALRATLADYPAVFVPVNSVDAISSALRALAQKKARDPVGFFQPSSESAIRAGRRFSVARFDSEMHYILMQIDVN